jgi:hypothetical protein
MLVFLFVTAMVALGLAGWNFNAVLEELRRSLPPQFGELDLRSAVGYHIWTPAASDTARRHYVWSHLWASLFALLTGILLWLWGELTGAALFGGLAVMATGYIAWQSYRYGARRRETSN